MLRHRRLGEADRIVTLLTPHRGKIDVVAKGLLRSRSKLAGHLEPLTLSEVVLAHGRSMDIVTQAQTAEPFASLHNDLEQLSTAMYLLELADRFTVEHADALDVYELLEVSLRRLARGDGVQLVTRRFELGVLAATGFRPELDHCLETGAPVAAEEGVLDASGGWRGEPGRARDASRGVPAGRAGATGVAGVSVAAVRGGGADSDRSGSGGAAGAGDARVRAGAGGAGAEER